MKTQSCETPVLRDIMKRPKIIKHSLLGFWRRREVWGVVGFVIYLSGNTLYGSRGLLRDVLRIADNSSHLEDRKNLDGNTRK